MAALATSSDTRRTSIEMWRWLPRELKTNIIGFLGPLSDVVQMADAFESMGEGDVLTLLPPRCRLTLESNSDLQNQAQAVASRLRHKTKTSASLAQHLLNNAELIVLKVAIADPSVLPSMCRGCGNNQGAACVHPLHPHCRPCLPTWYRQSPDFIGGDRMRRYKIELDSGEESWLQLIRFPGSNEVFIDRKDADRLMQLYHGHSLARLAPLASDKDITKIGKNFAKAYKAKTTVVFAVQDLYDSLATTDAVASGFGITSDLIEAIQMHDDLDVDSFDWFVEAFRWTEQACKARSLDTVPEAINRKVELAAEYWHEYLRKKHGRVALPYLRIEPGVVRLDELYGWLPEAVDQATCGILDSVTCNIIKAQELCEKIHGVSIAEAKKLDEGYRTDKSTQYIMAAAVVDDIVGMFSEPIVEAIVDLVSLVHDGATSGKDSKARFEILLGWTRHDIIANPPSAFGMDLEDYESVTEVPHNISSEFTEHFLQNFLDDWESREELIDFAQDRQVYVVLPDVAIDEGQASGWTDVLHVAFEYCGFRPVSEDQACPQETQHYGRIAWLDEESGQLEDET